MSVEAGMPRTQILARKAQGNQNKQRLELPGPEPTFGTGSSEALWAWVSWPSASAVFWESPWSGGMFQGRQASRPLPFHYGGKGIGFSDLRRKATIENGGCLKALTLESDAWIWIPVTSWWLGPVTLWSPLGLERLCFSSVSCKMTIVTRSKADLWCECSCSAWHFKVRVEMSSWKQQSCGVKAERATGWGRAKARFCFNFNFFWMG